ncbi:growth factor receptor-bound protein 14-like isoform X1 [Bombus bifarius]|uniref:Growth factor receptor-bound protein 14-like isoform X1 n=2 Tax=Bombus bifarius TaxID=103933 RepID=A0A6P8LM60_9HYME|nr:growth factor receptor-bound protein 14-like isoform X1 [Bombus bifarius]
MTHKANRNERHTRGDAIVNVAFSNTMLQPGDHDSVIGRPLYRRFPRHDPSSIDPKRRLADAMEPTVEIHDVSIDLPPAALSSAGSTPTLESALTITATASSESLRAETDNEQSVYSVALLDRCMDLVTRNDSVCDRQRYASSTWFSLVRRRCSNIRGWLPRMCSCLDADNAQFLGPSTCSRYQRLSPRRNLLEIAYRSINGNRRPKRFARPDESEDDEEQTEELRFYCDDDACYDVIVEHDLRAIDLCKLLKAKRSTVGVDWSIVETWPELGIERALEDHEDILAVHRETKTFSAERARKFIFRQDCLKYEFFHDPELFLSTKMIDVPTVFAEDWHALDETEAALRDYLENEEIAECPEVFGLAWIQNGRLNIWSKICLLLRDRELYHAKKKSERAFPFARLSDYAVYKITNVRKRYRAPFPWGICLRSTNTAPKSKTIAERGETGLKVIAFHSEKSRACWLTAMRLAKYGKQLRENYRAFKNKQCEQTDGPKDRYVNYNVSNESVRSRVAMDFTGSVGRIVDDPKEAKNIAESEGMNWRRTWRPFSRPPPGCTVVRLHGLDDGIHVLQPWFHRGLKRDIAAAIVRDQGSVDGVFLVRESKSNLGAYVLTYKYSEKVFHAQIQPVFDERCNCWLYTLDKGVTRFYDLLQLIEFYQLNAGCLPTRLTHYVQNGVPEVLPLPVPMALTQTEDGGGGSPPSPTELNRRRLGAATDGTTAEGTAAAAASSYTVGYKSI